MKDDEFWVEAITVDGHTARVHASFNEFSVTIEVERKNGGTISECEAERAYTEVMALVPRRMRFGRERNV